MQYCYLQFTDSRENHNKYYIINENDDGSIDVTYGRVGGSEQHHHYRYGEKSFYSLRESKLLKGYKDVTQYHQIKVTTTQESYKPIEDAELDKIINDIRNASVQFMKKYYTISEKDVTQGMLSEAYTVLGRLKNDMKRVKETGAKKIKDQGISYRYTNDFNTELEYLFTVVPRKMNKVENHLASSIDDFEEIVERESELLDSLEKIVNAQNVKTDKTTKQDIKSDQTILEANDIEIRPVTFEEEDYILKKLSEKTSQGRSNEDNYIKAYRVTNKNTEKSFQKYCKEYKFRTHKGTHFYFHGTKYENLWSIFKTGLTVNPKAVTTGKAFGNGIYFAEQSEKSLGYTNLAGKSKWGISGNKNTSYLLMYEVATGKSEIASCCHHYTKKELDSKKCQSVYAPDRGHGGVFYNSEIMIYADDQCTIRYIIEIDSHLHNYNIPYKTRKSVKLDKDDIRHRKYKNNIKFTFCNPLDKNTEMTVAYDRNTGLISDIAVDGKKASFTNWDKKWILGVIKRAYAESDTEWNTLINNF